MATVRREGKWTLEKDQDGVYEVCERGNLRARIITDYYEPQGMIGDVSADPMTETIEVRDFQGAEQEFQNFVEQSENGGLGLF